MLRVVGRGWNGCRFPYAPVSPNKDRREKIHLLVVQRLLGGNGWKREKRIHWIINNSTNWWMDTLFRLFLLFSMPLSSCPNAIDLDRTRCAVRTIIADVK